MNYSPSEVCEAFDIAKSTLYRWERDGKIPLRQEKLMANANTSKLTYKKLQK